MLPSATSSESKPRSWLKLRAIAAALVLVAASASSTVLITVEDALAEAFPGAETTRESLFLTEQQLASVERFSGVNGQGAVVTRYIVRAADELVGYAYLDTHKVRTLPETVMLAIDADGKILAIEVVSFREPMEYLPPDPWYEQFNGRHLHPELELKREIRAITGATLTARATTNAVRRLLAVHRVTGGGS